MVWNSLLNAEHSGVSITAMFAGSLLYLSLSLSLSLSIYLSLLHTSNGTAPSMSNGSASGGSNSHPSPCIGPHNAKGGNKNNKRRR